MDEKALTKKIGDANLPASAFLVVEDAEQVAAWHLPVKDASGEPDRARMGAAWASLHEGYRGNVYEGPSKQEAIRKLKALYKQIDAEPPETKEVSLDEMVRRVRDAFYAQFRPESGPEAIAEEPRLWPREVFLDRVIVESDDGLLSYPYILTDGMPTFGDPVPVEVVYQERKEAGLVTRIVDAIKGLLPAKGQPPEPDPVPGFMLWKEAGEYRWVARYSNNFRDDDNPPEIISADSHRRFVEMVDNKEAELPELWLWHRPEWKLGTATWVAYDDSGFALAGGVVDEKGVSALDTLTSIPPRDMRVSHGMPSASIERDGDDPTIITRHITREISPLPTRWAANQGTGFAILKENIMTIPTEKRQALIEQWGLSAEQLDALEDANATTAEAAKEAGIESKEVDDESAATTEKEEQETEQAETTETAVDPLTREEVATAFMAVLQPLAEQVAGMQAQLSEMTKGLDALQETDAAKIADKAGGTPAASLLDLMQMRAVGSDEAHIDGRIGLAKSKPKEAQAPTPSQTGVSFIDAIINGGSQSLIQ